MLKKIEVTKYLMPLLSLPTNTKPSSSIDDVFQCILFDVYGTLFISEAGDISSIKLNPYKIKNIDLLLSKYQIKKDVNRILKEYVDTISKKHKLLQNSGIDTPEIQIDRVWNEITDLSDESVLNFATEFELIVNRVSPMPNLEKLITACRTSEILMGIISNAQFYTEYLFHWFLGAGPESLGFNKDMLLYSYLSGHAKPSPHMFKSASSRLKGIGITENSVLYIGNDMLNDILPAKQVGFKTALFAGDARSLKLRKDDPRCKNLYPDIIVTDLIQLINYI
ncbi:MAG: HAD family hydrolase [Desulfobacterales bacterium]|nr:HAD family hydrolase [Desulfobacterales bacterium]